MSFFMPLLGSVPTPKQQLGNLAKPQILRKIFPSWLQPGSVPRPDATIVLLLLPACIHLS